MKALSILTLLISFLLFVSARYPSSSPSDFDFWRSAKELGQRALIYGNKELATASQKYTDVAEKIEEFKRAIDALGKGVREFGNTILSSKIALDSEDISKKLSKALEDILEKTKEEFEEPLPEDRTESYKAREIAVERALVRMENALVKVLESFGVPELETREKFTLLSPNIKHFILVTGMI
jgi:DNA anti-recombination protein RmuC